MITTLTSVPSSVTEIPVASPTATHTAYEEPSGEQHDVLRFINRTTTLEQHFEQVFFSTRPVVFLN